MTLQAKKRHCRIEKVVVDRAVRSMAVGTVFRDIRMLEHEGPLFLHVAPGAGVLGGCPPEKLVLDRAVRVMAVVAGHLFLHDRMMGEKPVFRFHFGVTTVAEFRHLVAADLLLGSLVELVAIEAAYVIEGVGAGVPVGTGRDRGSGVALEADKRLGLGGEILDVEKRARVAFLLLSVVSLDVIADIGNGQASRPMARLTIDQGKSCLRLDLLAMDAVSEIIGYLVVLVALRDTVVRSHILGIQPADDHLFVFPDGKDRFALLQVGTSAGQQEKDARRQKAGMKSRQCIVPPLPGAFPSVGCCGWSVLLALDPFGGGMDEASNYLILAVLDIGR